MQKPEARTYHGHHEHLSNYPYFNPEIRAERLAAAVNALEDIELDMQKPDFSANVRKIFYDWSQRNAHPAYSKVNTAAAVRLADSPIAGMLKNVEAEAIDRDVLTVYLATKVFRPDPEIDPKKVVRAVEVFQFSRHLLTPPLDYLAIGSLKKMIDGAEQLSPEEREEVWSNMLGSMNLREQSLTMHRVGLFEYEQEYRPGETRDEMAQRTGKTYRALQTYAQILGIRNRPDLSHTKNDNPANRKRSGDNPYEVLANEKGILSPEQYTGLVMSIAKQYEYRGLEIDDLIQVGMVEILKSMEKFEPSKGQFLSYARANVKGAIRRAFRDQIGIVKMPRPIKDRLTRIQSLEKIFTELNGHIPTDKEISELMGMTEQELTDTMYLSNKRHATPLEKKVDGELTLNDVIESPDNDIDMSEYRVEVVKMLNTLPERERGILYLRFFEELTQSEIADIIGVSQIHVSRLLKRALDQLSDAFGNQDISDLL